jgi:hypothetical protein
MIDTRDILEYLSTQSDFDLERTEAATLFIDREYEYTASRYRYRISHLHIYTRKGFETFLNQLDASDVPSDRMFGFALRL